MQHISDLLAKYEFHWWDILGYGGTLIFGSRFFLQWYITEKSKKVVIPLAFWWLSMVGSMMMLAWACITPKRTGVVIISYAFTWIPYLRNIMIHKSHQERMIRCPSCSQLSLPGAKYCADCGTALPKPASNA